MQRRKRILEMSAVGEVITRSSLVLGGFLGAVLQYVLSLLYAVLSRSYVVISSASSCQWLLNQHKANVNTFSNNQSLYVVVLLLVEKKIMH